MVNLYTEDNEVGARLHRDTDVIGLRTLCRIFILMFTSLVQMHHLMMVGTCTTSCSNTSGSKRTINLIPASRDDVTLKRSCFQWML